LNLHRNAEKKMNNKKATKNMEMKLKESWNQVRSQLMTLTIFLKGYYNNVVNIQNLID
jgi:hypothetical protein